jgi:hypothetical protein
MIKLSTLFWLLLVSTTGFTVFAVKYGVQSLEDELNRIKKAAVAEGREIRTDEAEWAYLTRPETLDEMNRRYLALGPVATKQLRSSFTDIPLRAPVEVPNDAPVVAAAEPPTEGAPSTASAAPVIAASLEKPVGGSDIGKPAPAKATTKVATLRHPRSLDELIAQVAAGR